MQPEGPSARSERNREYAEVIEALDRRWPDSNVVPVLDRESQLMELMGAPQNAYPVIQIAGTNGKTSTARMVDQLLRGFGLRVGRFTSPDFHFGERIALHGHSIDAGTFVAAYREVLPYVELVEARSPVRLTRFEVLTAMAFSLFADAPVDVAVVEVGMGGRWDCTNVADAQVAVVTPIGLDHQKYLGNSVAEIAGEKAGIIKPGASVICAAQPEPASAVILARCTAVGATIAREGPQFAVRKRELAVGGQVISVQGLAGEYDQLLLPVHGAHQAQNAAVALAAVESFLGAGPDTRQLDPDLVRAGFAAVTSPGRLERVGSAPTILLDAAHNPHGMAATVAAVTDEFAFTHLVAVLAVLADKDAAGMLELLEPVVGAVVCTRNRTDRAMPAADLANLAVTIFGSQRVHVRGDVPAAIELAVALANAGRTDLSGVGVLVTGSVVTIAEARALLATGSGAT